MSDPTEKEVILHYGPVYGRAIGESGALCDRTPMKAGESKTISRSVRMVDCAFCLIKIEKLLDEALSQGES